MNDIQKIENLPPIRLECSRYEKSLTSFIFFNVLSFDSVITMNFLFVEIFFFLNSSKIKHSCEIVSIVSPDFEVTITAVFSKLIFSIKLEIDMESTFSMKKILGFKHVRK